MAIDPDTRNNYIAIHSPEHGELAIVVWKLNDEKRTPSCEANARLITAAPEMFALLEREPADGHTTMWQHARRELLTRIIEDTP